MMHIVLVGMSHKTTPVEIREKVEFPSSIIAECLNEMKSSGLIEEIILISTCNRVEAYGTIRDHHGRAREFLQKYFADRHALKLEDLNGYFYSKVDKEAVLHLFRVASSLDSMVVGEPQIIGQVKDAYTYASEAKTTGIISNKLFHRAFSAAKRVRNETGVANNAVSVSFAAVELAKKIFGDLEGKRAMLVGAGNMCELAAEHLIKAGVSEIMVTNRTYENAVSLAKRFNGTALPLEKLYEHLHEADIVITSTGSPNYIIMRERVQPVVKQRRHKPMFFIDIAVPRDVDPKVNNLDNVYLYDIDDLQAVVDENLKEREKEAFKAEGIVNEEVEKFQAWLNSLEVVPTIVSLKEKFEGISRVELEEAISNLGDTVGEQEKKVLEGLAHGITQKILHGPITALKKNAELGATELAGAIRALFDLQIEPSSEKTGEKPDGDDEGDSSED